MGWGGGWGNHVPDTARTVAKAFYKGRPCKRGNCETDGMYYKLENSIIAWRENLAMEVAYALEHDGQKIFNPHHGPTIFSFAGWPTKMTARHLKALGLDAECYGIKDPSPRFRNIEVSSSQWYTLEDIEALVAPVIVPKVPHAPKFINLTAPLFA